MNSKLSLIKSHYIILYIMYMDTISRIQELANNSEIENSQIKGHAKISEFTVHSKEHFTCHLTLL